MNSYIRLLIGRGNRYTKALGYLDTGNMLKDKATGHYVVIASPEICRKLFSSGEIRLMDAYLRQNITHMAYYMHQGFYMVPVNTVTANDLMLAFDCDFFFMNNRLIQKKPLIGISRKSLNIGRANASVLLNKNLGRVI